MSKEKPDFVFSCRKCGHLLYASKDNIQNILQKMLKMECPDCGEEGNIWILEREGNYCEEQEC